MRIAVVDTNIFIDLIKTNLLPNLFKIGVSISTTEEVVNELLDHQQVVLSPYIKSDNQLISKLSADDIRLIESWPIPRGLSLVDAGLLLFAKTGEDYLILTNDQLLRSTCQHYHIEVHGILWLMDLFFDQGLSTGLELCEALSLLMKGFHRLPVLECGIRLTEWSAF